MPDDLSAPEYAADTIEDDRPSFRSVRKGYDPVDVDAYVRDLLRERDALVDELAVAAARDDHQRADLDGLRAELQAHADHAAAMASSPGSEGDRIVDSARAAALEIRTRAQIEANDLIKAANDEVRAVRADAEQLVVRRSREADEVAATRLREAGEGVRHAHEQAEALIRQTEQRADASLEAARSRAQSLVAEAEGARAEAVAEAAVIVHEAERRGRELIDEARSVREKIVGDLTRRRAKLRAQVEQLQAGRDRLLSAFQVVRDALDEATVELEVVLPEARDAALDAAQRSATEPDPVLDEALARLRADAPHDRAALAFITGEHIAVDGDDDVATDELVAVRADDAEGLDDDEGELVDGEVDEYRADVDLDRYGDGSGHDDVDGNGDHEGDDEHDGSLVAEDAGLDADADADGLTADDDGGSEPASVVVAKESERSASSSVLLGFEDSYGEPSPRRTALAPDPVEGRWSSAVRIIARPGPADAGDATDAEGSDGSAGSDPVTPTDGPSDGGDVPGSADAGEDARDGLADEHEAAVAGAPRDAAVTPSAALADAPSDGHRVTPAPRAEPAPAGNEREQRLPASLVGLVAPSPTGPAAGDADEAEALEPAAALEQRRDAALAGPRRQLRRRLKGILVEEENELLHAIRSIDAGVPKAHEVLPTEAVHRERFASAAQPGLLAATVAGQELGAQVAAEETRRRVPGALPNQQMVPPRVDTDTVDLLAADLAEQLATELRARVASCFPVGPPASDDPRRTRTARDDLMIAVRSAYRGTKAGFVDRVSDRAIAEALNRAVRAQIPAGVHPAGVDVRALFPVTATRPPAS